ncbi:hypothetical protein QBC38DRAFT_281768 [Podospora fimiseda]|uniref:DSC E3 ubiquitin ligase complex subunit 2 n=1 Tax=Podospora fimiseda TaxID=252190 RepID=A0AAN7BKI3_9PEZI|nr:hypothetical protein QBC38DRAFT_281768 [Podospora fimiseda]
MSFTSAPVTRTLVVGLFLFSLGASLFDIKHYFYISIGTHILRYHQLWRFLIYQLCYTNSSEVVFAAMLLYNTRIVEQRWGSRKFASFILVAALLTSIIPPFLVMIFRPLTFGLFDYLPAGPTPIIFAILSQYNAMIPHMYQYKVALSTGPPGNRDTPGVPFTDKSTKYLMAAQIAMAQFPGSLLGALVGWVVGNIWRAELLPGAMNTWRVPGWVVGIRDKKTNAEFENLRRRLETEGTPTGSASGVQQPQTGGNRRRTMPQQIMDEVRGAF